MGWQRAELAYHVRGYRGGGLFAVQMLLHMAQVLPGSCSDYLALQLCFVVPHDSGCGSSLQHAACTSSLAYASRLLLGSLSLGAAQQDSHSVHSCSASACPCSTADEGWSLAGAA